MINPLKYVLRHFALKKSASRVPQGIVPISGIRSAAVFVDRELPGAEAAEAAAREFFSAHGIEIMVLSPERQQLNYAGFMRRKFRMPAGAQRTEDLFVCLSDNPMNFAAEFESRCSPAGFKVGRRQIPGEIFDLVVCPPSGGKEVDQRAAFDEIAGFLLKIK